MTHAWKAALSRLQDEERRDVLINALERFKPPGYLKSSAIVIVLDRPAHIRSLVNTLRSWSSEAAIPFRIPHESISWRAMEDEVAKANGGILMLDDFSRFSRGAMETLYAKVTGHKGLSIAVIGADYPPPTAIDMDKLEENARILDAVVLDERGEVFFSPRATPAPKAPEPGLAAEDLEVINRHRRSLGMSPLDPSAGWTAQELQEMANRIRTTGRMSNPSQLKRRLLRRP